MEACKGFFSSRGTHPEEGIVAQWIEAAWTRRGPILGGVEYLSARDLREFVAKRWPTACGILQGFVTPRGHHNNCIRIDWSIDGGMEALTPLMCLRPQPDTDDALGASIHEHSPDQGSNPQHL